MPGFIGMPELILLALVALVLFGPKRLPEMGRGLGKGMREFKDSITGDHKDEHQLAEPHLVVTDELTTARTIPDNTVSGHPTTHVRGLTEKVL